jgi:hypothetical protein
MTCNHPSPFAPATPPTCNGLTRAQRAAVSPIQGAGICSGQVTLPTICSIARRPALTFGRSGLDLHLEGLRPPTDRHLSGNFRFAAPLISPCTGGSGTQNVGSG